MMNDTGKFILHKPKFCHKYKVRTYVLRLSKCSCWVLMMQTLFQPEVCISTFFWWPNPQCSSHQLIAGFITCYTLRDARYRGSRSNLATTKYEKEHLGRDPCCICSRIWLVYTLRCRRRLEENCSFHIWVIMTHISAHQTLKWLLALCLLNVMH